MEAESLSLYNKFRSSALLLMQAIYKPSYVFSYQNKLAPTIVVFMMLGLVVSMSQLLIGARLDVDRIAEKQFMHFQQDSIVDYNMGRVIIAPEDTEKFETTKQNVEKTLYLIPINSLFVYPISLVFIAVVLYLCQKVMRGMASMQDAMYITGFAFWPAFFINSVLSVIYVLLSTSSVNADQESFFSSPFNLASWLAQDIPKPMMALADSIDLFNFWALVLIIAGLSQVSKMEVKKTCVLVIALWGVFVAGKYLLVSLFTPEECFTCGAL
ncbi:MAG: YIP1 family protein [Candidatus Thiodiazotropha sp. (ex Dulcina madagascariensis)]|nr:YIP1 family protein [Candidatus Thiodiazotropha sp. (ex Dulcina madagascariensis)]